ncbi:MAG: ACT domain-containing protein, partial [Candidatus Jordarchaeaceae archaeon]
MESRKNIFQASHFVTINAENQVTLPSEICEMLGIKEGTRFLIIADKSKSRIILYPVILGKDKFAELHMKLRDLPGVLGKVATELGKININIESSIVHPSVKKISDFHAIINLTECNLSIVEIEERLKKLENIV